jgi:hypothetical protein
LVAARDFGQYIGYGSLRLHGSPYNSDYSGMSPENFSALLRKAASFDWHDQPESLEAASDQFLIGIADNFNKKEDSRGQRWPAHAISTVLRYGVHPLLILRTPMSVAAMGGANSVRIFRRGNQRLTVGMGISSAAIPYFRTHQHGDESRNIPQREFYYLSRGNRPKVVSRFRANVITRGNLPNFIAKAFRR